MTFIHKPPQELVFGQRESSRGWAIVSDPILIIWGRLRSTQPRGFGVAKNPILEVVYV